MSILADLSAALSKKRISIDQCFLSSIINGDPKSQKLIAALDAAHAGGRIICPIHLDESLVESSFLPEAARLSIFALQNRLSDGYSFHSFDQNLRYHTLAMLRPGLLFPALRKASLPLESGLNFAAIAKAPDGRSRRSVLVAFMRTLVSLGCVALVSVDSTAWSIATDSSGVMSRE